MKVLALTLAITVLISGSLSSAQASGVTIANFYAYIDNDKSVLIGEIINSGEKPVDSINIKVDLVGENNTIIDSKIIRPMIEYVPVSGRVPFILQTDSDVKSYKLNVINYTETDEKPPLLSITTSEEVTTTFDIRIRGDILNNGSKTSSVKVHATFYDSNGRAVEYAFTEVGSMDKGSSYPFEIRARNNAMISAYTLVAESNDYSSQFFSTKSISDLHGTINISDPTIIDEKGNPIEKISYGERGWIRSELENNLPNERLFTYIVQIKDSDGMPVAISWLDGSLKPYSDFTPKISWMPEHKGLYFAEIFLWESLENPVPLSSTRTIIILVD